MMATPYDGITPVSHPAQGASGSCSSSFMSASGSDCGFQAPQSYRLAGFTFHASAPQLVDDRALIGRGVGVGADASEPHPLTHSMHGIDRTTDPDDVDDDC